MATNKVRVIFPSPPPIETVVNVNDQVFELIGAEPYIRKADGVLSFVLTWHSECNTCGESYTTGSGLKVPNMVRNCDQHRMRRNASR